MFEPHIPLELVKEITEHLKSDPNDQKPPLEAIQVGKALSLVCREWCPVGQALRWDTLDVQLPLYPSLLEHFVSHPHLALYLRNLIQTQKTRAFDQVKHDEVHWTTAIVALLPLTPNLQHLGLTGDPGENGQEFLRAASSLPRLELLSISLFSENGLVLDKSIWLNGFPRLEYLKILLPHVTVLPLELAQTSSAPTEGRTKVSTLAAGWGCPATLESTFAEDFFSVFDPSTLLACNFAGSAVCRATFERRPLLATSSMFDRTQVARFPRYLDRRPLIGISLVKRKVLGRARIVPAEPRSCRLSEFQTSLYG
ncbi:uncharacterized protein JCM6883_000529 [Sporobolomyces salmoneus]|uniref:uncharacterized protein n=1 Tax=Sporobolomyces salmoneus TaxID=183962 RepID=UPI00317A24D7